ncbi:MAG: hypothetical protein ABI574_15820 [Burkholderiales bacterium]
MARSRHLWVRLFLSVVLAFALPLQGYAAAVMAFCGEGAAEMVMPVAAADTPVSMHDADAAQAPCHGHEMAADQSDGPSAQPPQPPHGKCSVCAACFASVALAATPLVVGVLPPAPSYGGLVLAPLDGVITAGLDRPPRAVLA